MSPFDDDVCGPVRSGLHEGDHVLGVYPPTKLGRTEKRIGIIDFMTKNHTGQQAGNFTRLLNEDRAPVEHEVRNVDLCMMGRTARLSRDLEQWIISFDGLIVTGAEPRSQKLHDDPVHSFIGRLLELAAARQVPTLFSCLSAHSALAHLHGLSRYRLPQKLFGVLQHEASHEAAPTGETGQPDASIPFPHSRWHTVRRQDLVASGVSTVLVTGPDDWGLARTSNPMPCTFLQAHPEYPADQLIREYTRDVQRYLAGESDWYPPLPVGYLTQDQVRLLTEFARQAADRTVRVPPPRLRIDPRIGDSWTGPGRALIADWAQEVVSHG